MLARLKSQVRDLLPTWSQVPAKYWFGQFRGTLEEEMKFLKLIVREHDLVIDVGGNRGIYTYCLWKLGAKVQVFEPNPICNEVLSAWATGKSSVTLHSVALSSTEGSANLHIPIDESGVEHDASASIENIGFSHARDELVPLRTLDSYQFEDVKLIKIDVEGHEFAVLEGASMTLTSSRPAMLVEVEQRHNDRLISDVFEKILDFGYEGFFLHEDELTPLENFEVARHQSMENFGESKEPYINNFLFLHCDRLADGEYAELTANF